MTSEFFILIIGYIIGFYMAWNIGANDVANSMASAVGAKAITIRQSVFIAGILNLVGAAFIGAHVTDTIRREIVATEILTDPYLAAIGALSAMLAAALWISFATWRSLPVSTTHSIVGAMVGFGIMAGGFTVINWGKLGAVVMSWVISPVFSLVIGLSDIQGDRPTCTPKERSLHAGVEIIPGVYRAGHFRGGTVVFI
jgi:inorganic phosphate transporter, PiT family